MANYVTLVNWTDQGVRTYQATVDRYQATQDLARQFGGRVTDVRWTLGAYDIVIFSEFPDDESMTAFALAVSSQGNIRTNTLRAYDLAEMKGIVGKAGGGTAVGARPRRAARRTTKKR
jgi:uncharacterized protein with GYD domain